MLSIENASHDTRSETSRGIQRSTGVEDPYHFCNEQRKSNTDRCNESSLVLLLRQHENRKHQLSSEDPLDEDPLHQAGVSRKSSAHIKCSGEKPKHHPRRGNTAGNLSDKEENRPGNRHSADENHAECDGGVEKTTGDTEEDPDVDHKGETEDYGNVEVD